MVVGVTGGIGSGKSTVTNYLKELPNVVVYIADHEAKALMNHSVALIQSVTNEFGEKAYKEGKLNRAYLSEIVFQNPEKLKKLNAIVHPFVHQHFLEFIKANKNKLIVYENAILFEIGSDRFCDIVINVIANYETRIERVMQRDQKTKQQVLDRVKNQWSDQKKCMLSNYVIDNDYTNSLFVKVQQIHNILTKKLLRI
jgi:dephospho-CoA kinase